MVRPLEIYVGDESADVIVGKDVVAMFDALDIRLPL